MARSYYTEMLQNKNKKINKNYVCSEEARGKDAWECSTIFRSCCFSMTSGSCLALTLPFPMLYTGVGQFAVCMLCSCSSFTVFFFVTPKLCKKTVSVLSCE